MSYLSGRVRCTIVAIVESGQAPTVVNRMGLLETTFN